MIADSCDVEIEPGGDARVDAESVRSVDAESVRMSITNDVPRSSEFPALEAARATPRVEARIKQRWPTMKLVDLSEELALENLDVVWDEKILDLEEKLAGMVPVVKGNGKMGRKHARRVVRRGLRRMVREAEALELETATATVSGPRVQVSNIVG